MPWLPMYLMQDDAPTLLALLSDDPEIAFLTSAGPKPWRAIERIDSLHVERIALWHTPSGPLPLLEESFDKPDSVVRDPWSGWIEKRTGADPTTPYFGPGHPGIIWLNLRPRGHDPNSVCGLSSFEWIGNRYRVLGAGATRQTERWWQSLRRRVARLTRKVPRQALASPMPSEIFAFPRALSALEAGCVADQNP